jgi:LytS/YehU family sensor histidine kinase
MSYFFISRGFAADVKAQAQEEHLKRLKIEKEAIETNLKMLQAQIEPHFLFNTLSNVLSLLDTDTHKGKVMLESLTHYLRTTLSKTRRERSTVGQEIELTREYLNIFKVRMGDRLKVQIDVPAELEKITIPPMLIQPLVENAIQHGIEPNINGGEISIVVVKTDKTLKVIVSDTGLGLAENQDGGVGLKNVRERLLALFEDQGRLTLEENNPTGVNAIIEVPYADD